MCSDATDEHYGPARQLLRLISNHLEPESKPAVLNSSASPSLMSLQGDDVPLTEQTVTQVREVDALPSATLVAITALRFYSSSEIYQ